MKIHKIAFSPFEVNTYIIHDSTGECVIIDPACYTVQEQKYLKEFISEKNLKPKALLNTHCHLDHVFGNKFISEEYNLESQYHIDDKFLLERFPDMAKAYGLNTIGNPPISKHFLKESDKITFGNSELKMLHIPGHSPGSLVFYSEKHKLAVVGDVIFAGSIGRTDLPGGDFDTLISGIKSKLYKLSNNTTLYPGHGPSTTVEIEKKSNPFVKGSFL